MDIQQQLSTNGEPTVAAKKQPAKKDGRTGSGPSAHSSESRQNMAIAHAQNAIVTKYLDAVAARSAAGVGAGHQPPTTLVRRLHDVQAELKGGLTSLQRLKAVQKERTLLQRLASYKPEAVLLSDEEFQQREDAFAEIVVEYTERHELHYQDWRTLGVAAPDLQRFGIPMRRVEGIKAARIAYAARKSDDTESAEGQ